MTCLALGVAGDGFAALASNIVAIVAMAHVVSMLATWWEWLAWTIAWVVLVMAGAWLGLTLAVAALYAWLALGALDAGRRPRKRL